MDYSSFRGMAGDVSRETFDDLTVYAALLEKWNRKINLVAPATIPDLWSRHILDSLQIVDLAPPGADNWLDLGSGGGLPGLVVAIALRDRDTRVTLIESDSRKATFLRTVTRELSLNAEIVTERIEKADPRHADVISARALAPLTHLLEFQMHHGTPTGVGLYLKGAKADTEVAEALERWEFSCEKCPSKTSVDSFVLKIGELKRA